MLKNIIQKRFFTGVVVLTIIFAFVPGRALALSNTVRLSPSSGTSQIGDTFTVSVDGSVGWTLFGTYNVEGTINFPSKLLKVNSIDPSGATFTTSTSITPDNSAGKITFYQGNVFFGANNKNIHLFDITFQTLKSGTANVTFGSVEYNTGSAGTTGGSYNIPAPPPPSPSPTPKPKPSPSPKPSPTQKPSPKPPKSDSSPTPTRTPEPLIPDLENDENTSPTDVTTEEEPIDPVEESTGGLVIEDVDVVANRQENYIQWRLNSEEAAPSLIYGTSADSLENESTVAKQEDGSYLAILEDLQLGTLYYFTITATSEDASQDATYSSTLTTRGYPVQLTIKQNNLLLPNAKVEINGRTFTSNKDAIILTELADGEQTATVSSSGATEPFKIRFVVNKTEVPANGNPDLQSFTLNVKIAGKSGGLNSSLLTPILASLALIIAIGSVVAFVIIRKRQTQQAYAITSGDSDLLAASYGGAPSEENNKISRAQLPPPSLMPQNPVSAPTDPVQATDLETNSYDTTDPAQASDDYSSAPSINNSYTPQAAEDSPNHITTSKTVFADVPESAAHRYQDAYGAQPPSQDSPVTTETASTPQEYTTASTHTEEHVGAQTQHSTYQLEQNNQTEAIYNQENGELEIIHHKEQESAGAPVQQASSAQANAEQKNDSKEINSDGAPGTRTAVAK